MRVTISASGRLSLAPITGVGIVRAIVFGVTSHDPHRLLDAA